MPQDEPETDEFSNKKTLKTLPDESASSYRGYNQKMYGKRGGHRLDFITHARRLFKDYV
jgi:hypothetical protein